jgi:ribonuclease inhibitor
MELRFDGSTVRSEAAFHDVIDQAAQSIGFVGYGRNLDALWDVLTGILPPPVRIYWSQAGASREAIGRRFNKLVAILHEAERELGRSDMQLVMED